MSEGTLVTDFLSSPEAPWRRLVGTWEGAGPQLTSEEEATGPGPQEGLLHRLSSSFDVLGMTGEAEIKLRH